jgi:hypothetical protein
VKKSPLPKALRQKKIRRESDPIPWKYCLLTLLCGMILAAGFFLAARTHFASIDLSIKNSDLRKQLQELEDEKRRLLLLKEKALSPEEIKKAARKIGLTEITADNIITFRSNAEDTGIENKSAEKKPVKKEAKDTAKNSLNTENKELNPKKDFTKQNKSIEKKSFSKTGKKAE